VVNVWADEFDPSSDGWDVFFKINGENDVVFFTTETGDEGAENHIFHG
jgi:hypothetical protein